MNKLREMAGRIAAWWERSESSRAPITKAAKRVLFVAAFTATVLALVWAVQVVPEWQVKRASVRSAAVKPEDDTTPAQVASLQNEMRKTFVQVVGGMFVVLALYLTYRRTIVTEQGHITDRYTKAIEQLGAIKTVGDKTVPNVEVRLGAIYALERIAFDSPRDHWTIMEVLTAYIRENAPVPKSSQGEAESGDAIKRGPATEVQAALTVLGRRRRGPRREPAGQQLQLGKCDLRGADFFGAHVEKANFSEARIEGANFSRAHVEAANFFEVHAEQALFQRAYIGGASFQKAHLRYANFLGADLTETKFFSAHLEQANFCDVHAQCATFSGAHMDSAVFFDAHLREAVFLEAHMQRVSFYRANLEGAGFFRTDLEGAHFAEAHLKGAAFLGAMGLVAERIREAEEWADAVYDPEFMTELGFAANTCAVTSDDNGFERVDEEKLT